MDGQQRGAEGEALDVASVVDEARERAARKRDAGAYGEIDPATVGLELEPPLTVAAIASGRRESLYSHRRWTGRPITLARRATVKLISPFLSDLLQQVNSFQIEAVREIERLAARVDALEAENARLRDAIDSSSRRPG